MDNMDEQKFELLLWDIFNTLSDDDYWRDELENSRVITFSEAGLLTMDRGVIIRLHNGQEFQLTIRQSK